ncbi:MAG: hypothetical protein V3W44_10035 [Dehalococcoidales bacterium]
MSMSTYIKGFKLLDRQWVAMKHVWESCIRADVDIPYKVLEFFDHVPPSEAGAECDVPYTTSNREASRTIYEVDIGQIPEGVKIIRFYNSW